MASRLAIAAVILLCFASAKLDGATLTQAGLIGAVLEFASLKER